MHSKCQANNCVFYTKNRSFHIQFDNQRRKCYNKESLKHKPKPSPLDSTLCLCPWASYLASLHFSVSYPKVAIYIYIYSAYLKKTSKIESECQFTPNKAHLQNSRCQHLICTTSLNLQISQSWFHHFTSFADDEMVIQRG